MLAATLNAIAVEADGTELGNVSIMVEEFVSTNMRRLPAAKFLEMVDEGLRSVRRAGEVELTTLPLDHRTGPQDPPYLKAAWIRL